jgi:hypothetical protein
VSDTPTTVVIAPAPSPGLISWLTGGHVDNIEFFLLLGIAILLRILWNLHKRGLDFADLLVVDGKLSWDRLLACTCGITTTWGFIVLILDNRITEWYFNGYCAICLGVSVWMSYLRGKDPPIPPA